MKISDDGLGFIAKWEGWMPRPYKDIVGVWTIGYGHVIAHGEDFPEALTQAEGMALLRADAAIAEAAVNGLGVQLTQGQFDALVSFAFNLGGGILGKGHTLGDALRRGDYHAAAEAFVLYDHAGGREDPGLKNRRLSERELFEREDCPPTDPGA